MGFKIDVEVPIFLLFFAMNFVSTITGNYVIYTTCYVTLEHNETLCALLGTNNTNNETAQLETEVQPLASKISTTMGVIDATLAPFLCFFFGSWSDKFGRKPIMLVATAGIALSYLIKCIISAIPYTSPWFLLISAIPTSFTGGVSATMTVLLCYITDTTGPQERGIKMFLLEGMYGLATVISSLTCAPALRALGYPGVFLIALLSIVLAWVYIFLRLPESVQNPQKENRFRGLIDFALLASTIKVVFKPRDNYARAILMATFGLLALTVFSYFGQGSVLFLYLRHRFSWALDQCNFYVSVMTAVSLVGGTVSIILLYKILRLREVFVLLISLTTCLLAVLYQGLAGNTMQFYISGSLNFLGSTVSPMCRSLLSKTINSEDIGKAFSVLVAIEAIFSLVGVILYTFVYNQTLTAFPQAFYFVTLGLYCVDIILVGAIMWFIRYNSQLVYEEVEERNEEPIN